MAAGVGADFITPTSSLGPKRKDPRFLTSLPEILSSLSSCQSEDAELSNSLAELLPAREPIVASLDRLKSVVPHLDELHQETSLLSEKVSSTAHTAERVGGRVRSLDEEMRRVREAWERVGLVMELKSSLIALQASIEEKDWESATRHCAKAMSIPAEVASGPFAENSVPTSESHLPPAQTLQTAREELLAIFRHHFDQASKIRDAVATSRFFKLFPAIGWEQEGLEAYASFVASLVRVRAPASAKTSSPLYYITSATALFESIAMIVDQHSPVVEKYYGSRRMGHVIGELLKECDRVVDGILQSWEEERSMKRKILDVSASRLGTSSANHKQTPQASTIDEDQIDPREINRVLSEAAGITGRWALFRKFLLDSLQDEPLHPDENDLEGKSNTIPPLTGIDCIESTISHKLFEDLLTTYYVPLEIWYARTVIDKAHRLSNADLSQNPPTTTTPDDVFYILKIVFARLLSTGSIRAVERTLEQLRDVMDQEYSGVIKRKLDDVYRIGGASASVSRGDKAERENRFTFIVLLNDLDISSSHMDRLTRDALASPSIPQYFLEREKDSLVAAISSFSGLVPRFRSALRAGIEQLFNQLMRPKLRTMIIEVYKDVSYVLDEDGYAQAENQDTVRKRFIKAWESLVDGYKDTFTDDNFRLLFRLALDVIIRPWEKFVTSLRYTELGAIRFDRDLRAIVAYLSSQTAFGDAREKFVRLQQISILLNLDSEEDVDEFYNSSGITWRLSGQEALSISNLKV